MKAVNEKIPTISICNLLGEDYSLQDLIIHDLKQFIQSHKSIEFPHRHSFYQLLYITKSDGGRHIIDFEEHEVKPGMLYIIAPSQVHEWIFNDSTEGVLINFNEIYFSSFLANSNYLLDFPFFTANGNHSVIDITKENLTESVEDLLAKTKEEYSSCNECKQDLIKLLLLELFIRINRTIVVNQSSVANRHNYITFRNFEKLIEQNYTKLRLPKDYAKLLFITPNHLNALCKQLSGKSAGDIIRNRILLEAKRQMINSTQTISEIGWLLNFEDNSYFTKFFKKHEGVTPDEFRKSKQKQ